MTTQLVHAVKVLKGYKNTGDNYEENRIYFYYKNIIKGTKETVSLTPVEIGLTMPVYKRLGTYALKEAVKVSTSLPYTSYKAAKEDTYLNLANKDYKT
ncbi:hypothetical protein B0A50_04620 [Salinomyces thailandicus]|uniref:Uncharacterized protein n=1 Tax=Salinomyces thailandicus TaxID=706561 RepID=A0A4U0TV38_9PEZI|nr:hypothetical protein B0A50_04620 [Salinomyces thailandica]